MRQISDPPFIAGMTKITDFAEADEILRSKDFVQGAHRESEPFFGDSLLLLEGDRHLARRRLEAPLFTKAALRHYEGNALDPAIAACLTEAREQRGEDGVVAFDLVPLVRTMLHRITAMVTGIDGVDTQEATERFRWFVEKLGEAVTVEWSMRDHDEVIREGLDVRRRFVAEFYEASVRRRCELIRQHRAGVLSAEELPRDLLTLLYLHWDESWDEDLPLRETALFLVAATQTTVHALPHVVWHLSEWTREHPEDRDLLGDRTFLRSAANESLRLHLPSPSLVRFATCDVVLASGRRLSEGERIALLATPANRDCATFGADADRFNPRRESAFKQRPWGLTFGGGEHLCIGRPLVTGSANPAEGEDLSEGTMVRILRALYQAGVEVDPQSPPTFIGTSFHDAYSSFPVVLTDL